MRDNAVRFLGKSKTSIYKVFNGCNIDKFLPDYSKRSKVFKILFVGRLVKQKDPITFLKAIEIFSNQGIDFIVTVAGDGPYLSKMKRFIESKNLSDKVNFKGWLSEEKLIDEYQSANLLLAPSLQEGMSIATMESLSCGLYTLTTPVSENKSLIHENINGELCQSGNYIELAEKIKCFYENKFLQDYKIPNELISKFKHSYNWKGVVDEYNIKIHNIVK
jgi:glycosyltransferase involved in cell wall biosynthesis